VGFKYPMTEISGVTGPVGVPGVGGNFSFAVGWLAVVGRIERLWTGKYLRGAARPILTSGKGREARELRCLLCWLVVGEQPADGNVGCCSSKLFSLAWRGHSCPGLRVRFSRFIPRAT